MPSFALLATRVPCVCATLDGGTLLAQGGIQILGTGDVSATTHDKFQQPSPDSGWCLSSVHRQSGGSCRYATETGTHSVKLCIIGLVIDVPVVVQRQVHSSRSSGRRHPCRGAEAVSVGPVQQTTEIHQLHSIDQVFDVPVAQVQLFPGAGREKLVEISQLQPLRLDSVVHTPVVCRARLFPSARNCDGPAVAVL